MDKNIISQQLNTVSKTIQSLEGAELYTSILTVCGELVNLAEAQIRYDEIDIEGVKDITASLIFIENHLENITRITGQSDCLHIDTTSIKKLEEAVKKQQELAEREQHAKTDLEDVESKIKKLKPQVEILEENFKAQITYKNSLEKSLDEYSDEKTESLKKQNSELVTKLAERQNEHKNLIDKQKEINEATDEINKKIAEMPTEEQLIAKYDEKRSYYERLLTAQEECSEEKQLEIQEKIVKIENEVEELKSKMVILRERKDNIDKAKTTVETEKGVFETDFIQKLEDAMDDLKNHMRSHRESLNALKDNAIELKNHINECDEIYKNYHFMFDACKTPLNAIANASKIEYTELAKTYDINRSNYVMHLKDNIEKDLDELGNIINECVKATAVDQASLKNKAFGGENK